MTEAAVDVVIPTMGRESLLKALVSAREQTVPVKIFIVLDDPSQEQVVSALLRDDEVLIVTEGRVGGAKARNIGVEAGSAKYVAFLDDDDWWEQAKTRSQLDAMSASNADLSFTMTYFHESHGSIRVLPTSPFPDPADAASYLVERPKWKHGDGYIQTSSLVVARGLLRETQWNADLPKHQDWDFVVRLLAKCEVSVAVAIPLVHVQQGSTGSISRNRSWTASRLWFLLHQEKLSSRAKGDFVATQILRGALAEGSLEGISYAVRLMLANRPHIAAVVVGISGVRERLANLHRS